MKRPKLTAVEKAEARDRFEGWLAHMGDFLEEFRASYPAETAAKLDYSLESLEAIEALVLTEFPTYEATLPASAAQRLNLFAIYVGETLRKQAGGKWDIPLDDPDYVWFNLPVISGCGPHGNGEACPLTLVTTSAHRRTGSFLRRAVEKRAGKIPADGT
jgi:hypothetical protein